MKYNRNHTKRTTKKRAAKKKGIGTMDLILIFVAATLFIFTTIMIIIFFKWGSIPDTLCTCVFAVLGGECGVMGWIKTNKDKQQQRKWDKEDLTASKVKNSDENIDWKG